MLKLIAPVFLILGFCEAQTRSLSSDIQAERLQQHQAKAQFLPSSKIGEPRLGWPQRKNAQTKTDGPQDLYDDSVYRTFEITYSDPNWHEVLIANYYADRGSGANTYLKADLMVDGETFPDVGVQYKGNSSFWLADNIKKPIKITMDAFVPGQDLYGFDIITLNNGVWDPTLFRELICYKILGKYMPAPRANIARVRAGISGEKFDVGVYTNVERIDKRFLEKHFGSGNGHRYKAVLSSMVWLGETTEAYRHRFSFSGTPPETAFQDLVQVIDVLNHTPENRLAESLDAVFSIDRAIRQISGGNVLLNWDDLRAFAPNGHNYYLYQVEEYGQMVILPWDWDLGLSSSPQQPIDEFFDNPDLPLLHRLMQLPRVKARYEAFLAMMASDLDWEEIGGWVENYRGLAEADILSGEYEFYTRPEYEESLSLLETTIKARFQYLTDHANLSLPRPTITMVSHLPKTPRGDETVIVSARISGEVAVGEVNLYYRSHGNFLRLPMYDDGAHVDGEAGDGIFAGAIPFQQPGSKVDYYIEAFSGETAGGAAWYDPIYTEHQPYTYKVLKTAETDDVVINEMMTHSHADLPDWIELLNTTDAPISVGDWFLSDSDQNFKKYQIASNQIIPARGYLVFYENAHFGEASGDPGRLEPFALSENGETLYLSSGEGEALTGFVSQETFGAAATGISLGRHHKPSTDTYNFVPMKVPTPHHANALPLVGPIVISEIMYAPATHPDAEYLELLNTHSAPVTFFDAESASPWKMTDGIKYTFPVDPPLTLAPGSRVLLVKDFEVFATHYTANPDVPVLEWESGSLNNAGEKVELAMPGDVNQNDVRQYIRVDRINYGDEPPWPVSADGEGMALGRKLIGGYGNDVANWQAATPTPGVEEPPLPMQKLIYPWISNRSGEFESALIVNNLSAQSVTVQMMAKRADGASQTVERLVPARGFLQESAVSLFPVLGSGAGYTVSLTGPSHQIHGVWVTHSLRALSGKSPSQGVAISVPDVLSAAERRRGKSIGFGYLPVADNFLSAPVVINAGASAADVQLQFFNRNGVQVSSQTLPALAPGQPYAVVANSLISDEDPEVMMLAHSSSAYLTGVSFVFNDTFFETAIGNATRLAPIATPDVSKNLIYPWISNREGQFQSTLVAANYGDQAISVQLTARRESGPNATTTRLIDRGGFLAESAQSLFPGLGSGSGYSVVLDSPRSHVFGSWVSRNQLAASGDSPAQGVAVELPAPNEVSQRVARRLLLGYLPLTASFFSAPVIVNTSTEPTDVTLYFFNRQGELLHKDETSFVGLQPMRPYARLANDILVDQDENVQVIAEASSGTITGVVFIFNDEYSEPAIGNAIAIGDWLAPEN